MGGVHNLWVLNVFNLFDDNLIGGIKIKKENEEVIKEEIMKTYDVQLHPVYEIGQREPKLITFCVWEIIKESNKEVRTLIESYNYYKEK